MKLTWKTMAFMVGLAMLAGTVVLSAQPVKPVAKSNSKPVVDDLPVEVLHLFLNPDGNDEIKVWPGKISQEGLRNPPVIYRDPDARLAREFGIPDGYQFHGQTIHYPALVLLDSSGNELFRYVGKDNTDRTKPDDFIARLAIVTDRK